MISVVMATVPTVHYMVPDVVMQMATLAQVAQVIKPIVVFVAIQMGGS